MTRIIIWLVVVIALVGGAIWLSGKDTTKPLTRVEKTVTVNALSQ